MYTGVSALGAYKWRVWNTAGGKLTGSHGQRVARQGAGLVHGASRGDHVHDIAPAAVGTDRETAANDLRMYQQRGIVRTTPKPHQRDQREHVYGSGSRDLSMGPYEYNP